MSRSRLLAGLALGALLSAAASSASAEIGFDISNKTAFSGEFGTGGWSTYSGRVSLVDGSYSVPVYGGVTGSPPIAFGAEVYAAIKPKLGLEARISSVETGTYGATANVLTQIRGADVSQSSRVGETFTLATTSTISGDGFLILQDQFQGAALNLKHSLTLGAGVRGCVLECAGYDWRIGLGEGTTNIAAISAAGEASLLGVPVGSAPFNYTDASRIVTLTGNVPDFDAGGPSAVGGPGVSSRQGVFNASVDVAQAFAKGVGLDFPLSGEVAGFDYTLLSAKVGVGFDMVKSVAFEASKTFADYIFSAPVSVFDNAKGAWSDMVDRWQTSADGSELMIRAPGAATLGVARRDVVLGDVVTDLNMVGYVSGSVTALGLNGYGLEFGPLLDETIKFDIGSVNLGSDRRTVITSAIGDTFYLTFDKAYEGNVDPCASGCSISAFLDARRPRDDFDPRFDVSDSTIIRLNNFNPDCQAGLLYRCGFDDGYLPLRRQVYTDTLGILPTLAGTDLPAYLAALSAPGFRASQSDLEQIFGRLRAMGIDPANPQGFAGLGPGASPDVPILQSTYGQASFGAFVPEPATWVMMIGGFGAVGWAMRRRRAGLARAV